MQISSCWDWGKEERERKVPNEKKRKMKGCISAAQMFANKLLPGLKKADQSWLSEAA